MTDIQRKCVSSTLEKYGCGDVENMIFDASMEFGYDYAKHAYEIIGALSQNCDVRKCKSDIEYAKSNFALSFFDVYRRAKLDKIRITNLKPESTVGLFTCKRCKGNKFWVWSAQTRSADEGMTTFAQCTVCPPELGRFKC